MKNIIEEMRKLDVRVAVRLPSGDAITATSGELARAMAAVISGTAFVVDRQGVIYDEAPTASAPRDAGG